MTRAKLLSTVKGFRKGILKQRSSEGFCFALCWPLEGYLRILGVNASMIQGSVDGFEHYWLELADGTVLDPTADQFNYLGYEKMPPVYIGPKPHWYGPALQEGKP